jgi:chemosensory pili system protein ChpA (sensor histidine kinase/response regulator)
LNTIEGIVRVSPYELEAYYQPDAPAFEYAGQPYDLRYLGHLLRVDSKPNLDFDGPPLPVVLVRTADYAVAVQVDALHGSREVVVKSLGPQFGSLQGVSGATLLGDGSVVVILDLIALIRSAAVKGEELPIFIEEDRGIEEEQRKLLVMVVDDSVTVRKVTSRFLERQGMEVITARDGVDAMTLLRDNTPDVMLLDIEMPRMDGFEVANQVRHHNKLSNLPIIMITSRTGDKHRERAFSIGVNKYLGKPYQEMDLLRAITELVGEERLLASQALV